MNENFSANDIIDAWNALFPDNDGHDVALVLAWLDEYRPNSRERIRLLELALGDFIEDEAENYHLGAVTPELRTKWIEDAVEAAKKRHG